MSKTLVRAFSASQSNVEVIGSDEATSVALTQIADIANAAVETNDSTHLMDDFADILELMHAVMKNKNINPELLFGNVAQLRQSEGTFDLNTVSKE